MSNSRSIKAKHRRPSAAARRGQRAVVLTVTGGMAAGGFIAGAGSAVADHRIVSQAEGYFLSGNVASLDLKTLLPIAKAVNKSHSTSAPPVIDSELGVNLGTFGLPNVPLPAPLNGVNLLGSGGILDAGVLNEYARANSDGSSYGASGAVTKTGAIESGAPNQNAQLNLSPLLGGVVGTVADIDLSVGALAASAKQTAGGTQTGDYKIADLKLNIDSPALATVLGTLDALGVANTALPGQLDALADVAQVTDGLPVPSLIPVGDVTLTNVPDIADALTSFNNTLLDGSDGISINPSTGAIEINVSELVNLNNLPPNTDILPLILGALDGALSGALGDLADAITEEFNSTTGATLAGVPLAGLPLDAVLATITGALGTAETTALGIVTGAATGQNSLLDAGTGGLIGDILNDTLDLVANVQVKAGGIFTERALSVGLSVPVLNSAVTASAVAEGSLALINLANAAVGPNAGPQAQALAPPVITEPDNGDETTDRTPQIEGTGVPGAKVTVKEGSNTICTATVRSNGKWECDSERLSLGDHTIVATQRLGDLTSARSNRVTFEIVAANDNDDDGALPNTGGNGSTAPLAAAALGLMLGGLGLTAAPRLGRHGGARSGGTGSHAGGGRHARR